MLHESFFTQRALGTAAPFPTSRVGPERLWLLAKNYYPANL